MTNTYQEAGVNIDEGNKAVNAIKDLVKSTYTPNVLTNLGNFAGMFELPKGYEQPVLVACTDGVGTKLKWAIDTDTLEGVGLDLVAMCVNDLICCGAKPLFFLDYIAMHKLETEHITRILKSITEGCKEADCALIGGEMAEMNDMYQPKDFDLAGFSVGIVEKKDCITGKEIKAGNNIYAIPSSGIHSNGFSLVRHIYKEPKKEFLTPTRIYVKIIEQIIATHTVTGIAHITGGGLSENITRILPKERTLNITKEKIRVLDIFKKIQKDGNISEDEMSRVFNMGIGMVVITPDTLPETEDCYWIGEIV